MRGAADRFEGVVHFLELLSGFVTDINGESGDSHREWTRLGSQKQKSIPS